MSGKILKGLAKDQTTAAPWLVEGGVVRKQDLAAQGRAQKILAEAQAEAAKITEEAKALQARVEREMEAAKARGYQEGKAAALEEFAEQIAAVKKLKEKFLAEAEPEIIQLVLNIAEKVLGEITGRYEAAIAAVVQKALERSLGDRIVVRLHPEDWQRIQTEEPGLKEKLDKTKHLHFKEDETIQRGGCIVETEVGTIDAQLGTQLRAVTKAFGA